MFANETNIHKDHKDVNHLIWKDLRLNELTFVSTIKKFKGTGISPIYDKIYYFFARY